MASGSDETPASPTIRPFFIHYANARQLERHIEAGITIGTCVGRSDASILTELSEAEPGVR
jgi:hypothetical protein